MDNKEQYVYVCKTDYDYHIPDDMHGIRIFFTVRDIKQEYPCVKNCGIVKLKLTFEGVVDEV